ncbi:MAG: hypothetical protein Q7R40_13210 [Phaeospirillum sp.]|nr:hypothetical protein [Phaeospirillum sp.]
MTGFASTFLPTATQLLSLGGLAVVALCFSTIGAALGGRDRLPEADLLVGWSLVAGLFTVAGGVFDASLTAVAVVAALMTVASAVVLWRRREPPVDGGNLAVLLWMLPLLIATASMRPSQWDEFSQWLPNARYLMLFDAFPGPGHPVSDSVFPGYPPAVTVIYYLVGRLIGQFTDTVAPWFNLLLLAGGARLMVRLFRGDGAVGGAAAWGVLGVTVLGTTFVPKLVLSGYADTATAVAVGFSAVLGLRLWETGKTGGGWGRALQFALVFALLPMTKQGNFALMGLLVLALAWESWRQGDEWGRHWMTLAAALAPAAVATLAWRLHVASSGGDMSLRAVADWQWDLLPEILTSMRHVASAKGGYFGLGLVVVVLALWKRSEQRLIPLFAFVFVGYNVFLLFVYLAILGGYESANAASFWRYNTHLGSLEMLVAALLAGQIRRRLGDRRSLSRAAVIFGGLAAIIVPFATQKYIRFDRQPTKMNALATIAEMAPLIPSDARLMLIDARGTGFFANFTNYHLGFGRHVIGSVTAFNPGGPGAGVAALNPDFIWVRTVLPNTAAELGLPLDETASNLVAVENGTLRLVKSWPYPANLDPASDKD